MLLRSDAFAGEVAPLRRYASRRRHPWGVCGGGRDRRERHGDIEVREREGSWEKLGKVRAWRSWVLADDARPSTAAPPARRRGRREVLPAGRAHGRRRAPLLRSDHCRVCHGTPARERTNGGGARAFEGGDLAWARRRTRRAGASRVWRGAEENERVGVRCGVLDQASIALAERDALTLIDCAETHARIRLGADREGRSGSPVRAVFAEGPRTAVQNHARVFARAAGSVDVHLEATRARRGVPRGGAAAAARPRRVRRRPRRRLPGDARAQRNAPPAQSSARAAPIAHFFGEAKRVADVPYVFWRRGDSARSARSRRGGALLCGELRVRVRAHERAARDRRDARRVRRAGSAARGSGRASSGSSTRRMRRRRKARHHGRRTRRRFRNAPATSAFFARRNGRRRQDHRA